MKKTLYLMRHGQTLFNARKKIQGWCDAPLTELGIKQAKIAGKYFKDNNIVFDHAYSSTSERACDTLELVCDLPYHRVKGLKEWNFGIYEGESEDLNPVSYTHLLLDKSVRRVHITSNGGSFYYGKDSFISIFDITVQQV